MKNIKKLGKRILCGVIAVMSMLSANLSVYAADNTDISTRTYFSGTDYQGNRVQISADARFLSVRSMHVSTDGSEDKTWTKRSVFLITNNPDVTYIRSIGDVTVNINTAIGSQLNLLSCLLNNLGADTVNSVLSDEEKQSLSDYSVICLFNDSSIGNYYGTDCYDYELTHQEIPWQSCPIGGSLKDLLVNFIKPNISKFQSGAYWDDDGNLKEPSDLPDTGGDTSQEPPKFYLKTYNDYGMNKYSEYTLTWDTKGSFVEGKESDYGFKVYIAKENKPSDAKVLDSTKISPCLFSASSLVFTWQDVKDLFSFLSTSKLENRFDVFIQITDKSGKAVSDNYIHFLVIKRMEIRDSNYIDKDGNEKKSYGKWENGQFEYTDGRETSAEDKKTNSNGSSTAPSSNVKNDGYTNVENAPSSSNIDASATKSLINSLSTIASTLGDVPALIAQVYSWLPSEVITLIGTGIGLIVLVGIIKWIL